MGERCCGVVGGGGGRLKFDSTYLHTLQKSVELTEKWREETVEKPEAPQTRQNASARDNNNGWKGTQTGDECGPEDNGREGDRRSVNNSGIN
jgi:hypothetical protein